MLPTEGGEHFSNKSEQTLRGNCGLSNISRNGTADDTRNAQPRRAISKKYTFPMDFANFEVQ